MIRCKVRLVTQSDSDDERFGSNLRVIRERRGISQADLARVMSERGISWAQQTVAQTEAGKRPMRLSEAAALAAILQTPLDRFMLAGQEASELEAVLTAGARLRERWERAAQAVCELLDGHARAAWVLDLTEGSKYERVREARDELAARMGELDLEAAAAEGIRLAGERGAGPGNGG